MDEVEFNGQKILFVGGAPVSPEAHAAWLAAQKNVPKVRARIEKTTLPPLKIFTNLPDSNLEMIAHSPELVEIFVENCRAAAEKLTKKQRKMITNNFDRLAQFRDDTALDADEKMRRTKSLLQTITAQLQKFLSEKINSSPTPPRADLSRARS